MPLCITDRLGNYLKIQTYRVMRSSPPKALETVTYYIFLMLERGSPLIYTSFEAFEQIRTEA